VTPQDVWYGDAPAARLASAALAPLGWAYCGVAALRAALYRRGWLESFAVGAPVLVVGNLSVGGTGKTPLVRWLGARLRERGLRPGIAARGYRGSGERAPAVRPTVRPTVRLVPPDGDPALFGDEPVLLAADGSVPVAVGADRVAVARALIREHGCDVVVTDDGLQHYRLRRCCEILVQDGARGHGNGRCLPAGPLREPERRAARADLCIATGGRPGLLGMALVPGAAVSLAEPDRTLPLAGLAGRRVTAVAGIGNPARFFGMLEQHGIGVDARPYPDHHRFTAADMASWGSGPVLMTEKDAVKCRRLGPGAEHWLVPVRAVPDVAFIDALDALLARRGVLGQGPAPGRPAGPA
jgi:tetraacyldisaccharide 4'-kinase